MPEIERPKNTRFPIRTSEYGLELPTGSMSFNSFVPLLGAVGVPQLGAFGHRVAP